MKDVQIEMNYGLKEKIMSLRNQGMSYRKIEKELGCSKGTIAYHLGEGQKKKTQTRMRKNRKLNPLQKKIDNFKNRKYNSKGREEITQSWEVRFKNKIKRFRMDNNRRITTEAKDWNDKDVLKSIGSNPKCYLTGDPIDIKDTYSYHADHIVPRSKGGDSSFENLALATREANQAKGDMSLEEFYTLCEKVLKNRDKN